LVLLWVQLCLELYLCSQERLELQLTSETDHLDSTNGHVLDHLLPFGMDQRHGLDKGLSETLRK